MIIRQDYVNKIEKYVDKPFIKVLTGVRRCGKSTILLMIQDLLLERGIDQDHIISYNFSLMQYHHITNDVELYDELKGHICKQGRSYLFLDEIQEIDGWEKTVNSFREDDSYDVDIYVTGSNSRMMSSEISTYLTGRYVSFNILPLSFAEYIEFHKSYEEIGDIKKEFAKYLRLGGFPAVNTSHYEYDEAYAVVHDIYNSTVFSDIVRRYNIRNIDLLERVVKYVMTNVGMTFSASSIVNYLKNEYRKTEIETVYSYLEKLESAYLIDRVSRYDLQGKEVLKTQEKFYLADPSFRYAVLGYTDDGVSSMLENVVYLELVRRGYKVYVGKDGVYEIDFVGERKDEKIYIQVSRHMDSEDTKKREYQRLLKAPDNYPKYVLTTDEYTDGSYNGIKTMHIADWLIG